MTAGTDQAELFDPRAHEALTESAWDTDRAGAAIREIVAEAERAFEHDSLWPPHSRDLRDLVERRFGVSYSEAGMLRLLHGLDLSWQKARPVHPEADAKAQERFKKTCPR